MYVGSAVPITISPFSFCQPTNTLPFCAGFATRVTISFAFNVPVLPSCPSIAVILIERISYFYNNAANNKKNKALFPIFRKLLSFGETLQRRSPLFALYSGRRLVGAFLHKLPCLSVCTCREQSPCSACLFVDYYILSVRLLPVN